MSNRTSWMNRYCWRRRVRYESADKRIVTSNSSSNSLNQEIETVQYECCPTCNREGSICLDVYSSGRVEVSNDEKIVEEMIFSISDWRQNERKVFTNVFVITGLENDTVELPKVLAA